MSLSRPPALETPAKDTALTVTASPLETKAFPEPALRRAQVTRSCFQPVLQIHSLFLGTFHVKKQSHFPALQNENNGFYFPSILGRVMMRRHF